MLEPSAVTSLSEVTLTLFFTRRTGLCDWERAGILEREVELYRRLSGRLRRVNFITYGGSGDRAYASRIAPIELCPVPRYLPVPVSRRFLGAAHRALLRESDVFKTNQVAGAEVATWLKQKFGKRLISRCGYLYSRFMQAHSRNPLRVRRAVAAEKEAFTSADAVWVTSERDREWAIETHGLPSEKVAVIPNYVLTEVFQPIPGVEKTHDVVCVARAGRQKNVAALLGAMSRLKEKKREVSCLLIGSAASDTELQRLAKQSQLPVSFFARVPNLELPAHLNRCKVFVMPSLYEGHPKALLEAMSCGLPCIGADVVGVREELRHRETGYLCGADPTSLAAAIERVLEDSALQKTLGKNARRYIESLYTIDRVIALELQAIESLLLERG